MKPYTPQQLSLILGEHAAGQLVLFGAQRWGYDSYVPYPQGCIEQAVQNEPDLIAAGRVEGGEIRNERARWFDNNYRHDWTAEQFLAELAAVGLA